MAIIPTPEQPKRNTHSQPEANIQASAYTWFWNTYPQYRGMLFAVTNQNDASPLLSKKDQQIMGARRKALGVYAGVSDLVCLIPRGGYHGLMLECKTAVGRQSEVQRQWEQLMAGHGYLYCIFRSLEEFKTIIDEYLRK